MNGRAHRHGRPASQPPPMRGSRGIGIALGGGEGRRRLDAAERPVIAADNQEWTPEMVSCLTTIREKPLRFRQSEVGIFHPASLFADNFDELEMELRPAPDDDAGRLDMENSVPVWNSSFCFVDALRRYAARGPEYRRMLVPQIPSLLRGDALEWWYSVTLDAGQHARLRSPETGLNVWCTMLEERFGQNPAMFMQVLNVERFTLQDVADQKNFATWVFRLAHKALVANYRLPGLVMLIYERLDVYLMEEFPYPDVKKGLDAWVRYCMRVIPELYIKCTEGAWRDLVNMDYDDDGHTSDSGPHGSASEDEAWPLPPVDHRRHTIHQNGYEPDDEWLRPSSSSSRPSRRSPREEPVALVPSPVVGLRNGLSRKPRSEVQRLHQAMAALKASPPDASGGRWISPDLHDDLLHILGNITIGPPPPRDYAEDRYASSASDPPPSRRISLRGRRS